MLLFLEAVKPMELVLILVVVLLLFGGKKIPELMRGLGQGMKEFKNAKDGIEKDKIEKEGDDTKGQLK